MDKGDEKISIIIIDHKMITLRDILNLQSKPGDKNRFVLVEVIVVEIVSNPSPPRSPLLIPIA